MMIDNISSLILLYEKITGNTLESKPSTISEILDLITEDYTTADPTTIKEAVTDWLNDNPDAVSSLTDEQKNKLDVISLDGDGKSVLFNNGNYANFEKSVKNIVETMEITGGEVSENGLTFTDENVEETLDVAVNESIHHQEYLGGYIEIQPDSWDGSVPSTDATSKTWGFPMSLLPTEQVRLRERLFNGSGTNIMYIRLPLGFAYRGYRNVDETSGLAKNIGERFLGQNKALRQLMDNISEAGGGIAPEYWCPPVHWLTSGAYNGGNQLSAGGTYDRTVTLASIKATDVEQYNTQIDLFTDAIIDDLEYLHKNVAPVRMFSLQNEPQYATQAYGACKYDAQTYNDVLEVLYEKIQESEVLSVYNEEVNEVKLLVASSDEDAPFGGIAKTFIDNHSEWIWGYTHHSMRKASGEAGTAGADWYKSSDFANLMTNKSNVFINEYEYFTTNYGTDEFRCSNNMARLINESVYGKAKVLHPVIHICKPLGQTLASTNTKGYCLCEVNLKGDFGIETSSPANLKALNKGTFSENETMFNSWAMFGDNLPVGAYLIGEYTNTLDNFSYCTYKFNGKVYLFLANNGNTDKKITITFDNEKELTGKYYDECECGKKICSKSGKVVEFVVPAYSGQFWMQVNDTLTINSNVDNEGTASMATFNVTSLDAGSYESGGWSGSSATIDKSLPYRNSYSKLIELDAGDYRISSTSENGKFRIGVRIYNSDLTISSSFVSNNDVYESPAEFTKNFTIKSGQLVGIFLWMNVDEVIADTSKYSELSISKI